MFPRRTKPPAPRPAPTRPALPPLRVLDSTSRYIRDILCSCFRKNFHDSCPQCRRKQNGHLFPGRTKTSAFRFTPRGPAAPPCAAPARGISGFCIRQVPRHALREKGLQRQRGVGPLVSSQDRGAHVVPRIIRGSSADQTRSFCPPIGLHRISLVRASEESFKTVCASCPGRCEGQWTLGRTDLSFSFAPLPRRARMSRFWIRQVTSSWTELTSRPASKHTKRWCYKTRRGKKCHDWCWLRRDVGEHMNVRSLTRCLVEDAGFEVHNKPGKNLLQPPGVQFRRSRFAVRLSSCCRRLQVPLYAACDQSRNAVQLEMSDAANEKRKNKFGICIPI